MNIKLSNWKDNITGIVYPIRRVPSLPAGLSSFTINCESTLIQWLEEFVKLYGNGGFIKLKEESDYSIMRIYNDNYLEDTFKVVESVERFGGSLD